MTFVIAIQPDDYGPGDASSPLWTRLIREAGHEVRAVDVRRADILQQVRGCDGFMWRYAHTAEAKQIASRLLPVLERTLGLAVYPDQATCWHFDDKIAQRWLLEAAGVPIPRTWIWFDGEAATEWARGSEWPMVLKLRSGAGSTNVRRVESFDEARRWIGRLFGAGVYDLAEPAESVLRREGRALKAAGRGVLRGVPPSEAIREREVWDLHKGYAFFQEFLPGNEFDTRVTVIGDRAFAFRRFNRPGDFRASGSGHLDHDPAKIDIATVRLAFDAAGLLGTQSMAIDGLRRGDDRLVGEISYAYVSWAVHDCPGHWKRSGGADPVWVPGPMWPEEAQVADFLRRLEAARTP